MITSTILKEHKITEQELKTAAYQNIKPDIRPMYEYLKDYGMIDMLHENDILIVQTIVIGMGQLQLFWRMFYRMWKR